MPRRFIASQKHIAKRIDMLLLQRVTSPERFRTRSSNLNLTLPIEFAPMLLHLALMVILTGCGSRLPTVSGTVTLDDAPLANAKVVFEAPDKPMAVATTDAMGNYDVMTGTQRGMAAGSYQVAISAYATKQGGNESPIPILLTPKRYNSAKTSELTAEVKEGRNDVMDFSLKGK